MTETTARTATVATLTLTAALAVAPLLGSAAAAAEGGSSATRSKAAIEHDERVAAVAPSTNKAQIEHDEMTVRDNGRSGSEQSERVSSGRPETTGGDAAAWQLALSAAMGALVTGVALVGARQVSMHRSPQHAVAP